MKDQRGKKLIFFGEKVRRSPRMAKLWARQAIQFLACVAYDSLYDKNLEVEGLVERILNFHLQPRRLTSSSIEVPPDSEPIKGKRQLCRRTAWFSSRIPLLSHAD